MTTTTEQALTVLAQRLAQFDEQIENLTQQRDQVKAAILALVPGPDTYQAGALAVQVVQSHTLDKKAIAAKYPAADHPELYEQTVSTTAVKKHLAPVDLEAFQVPSKPSVRLK